MAEKVLKRKDPQVALINIGTEDGKGREFDKETFALLKASKDINFYGNLEPKEIFLTDADILLSDGFTANIVMKTMEGTAKGLSKILKRENRIELYKDSLKFLKTRVNLDLALFKDDIWSH